jgi:hypothetical protein
MRVAPPSDTERFSPPKSLGDKLRTRKSGILASHLAEADPPFQFENRRGHVVGAVAGSLRIEIVLPPAPH